MQWLQDPNPRCADNLNNVWWVADISGTICKTDELETKRRIKNNTDLFGDHQRGSWCNRSTADCIFCIPQILDKKWEYNEVVHQLFIDFKKAHDSVRWEVMCNIVIEFGVHMKLVRLIKLCLNETYSTVWVGKHLSDMFPIRNGLKQEDALLPLPLAEFR
jgi:hypothetical protein